MRWTDFMKGKGKELKKTPYSLRTRKTVRTLRDEFKKVVRLIVQCTADDLTRIAFSANECPNIHRLRSLNVMGHEACIRARPELTHQQVHQLTVNMLQLEAGSNKKL